MKRTEVNHFSAVLLNDQGEKIRGYDYRGEADARRQQQNLAERGLQAEVWTMNVYGERLDGTGHLAECLGPPTDAGWVAVRQLAGGLAVEQVRAAAESHLR